MRKPTLRRNGLTIEQLIRNTPVQFRYMAAGFVSVSKMKARRDGEVHCETITQVLGDRSRRHQQIVRMVEGASWRNGRISFNCSCEDFMYICEVALHRHGAAEIMTSNGAFPYQTNPKGIPMVCKHGLVVLRRLSRTRYQPPK